jgi:hypothetical protein
MNDASGIKVVEFNCVMIPSAGYNLHFIGLLLYYSIQKIPVVV